MLPKELHICFNFVITDENSKEQIKFYNLFHEVDLVSIGENNIYNNAKDIEYYNGNKLFGWYDRYSYKFNLFY